MLGSGIGLAIGGGALALAFRIGDPIVGQAAAQLDLSVAALDVIYGTLVASMLQTAQIVALLGVFIAVLGWFMGLAIHLFQVAGSVVDTTSGVSLGAVFDPDSQTTPVDSPSLARVLV